MTDPTPCPFHEFNAGVARARHAYEENPTIGSRLCGICARWLGDDRHRICRGCSREAEVREWTRQGDPIPRYAPCASCGVTTIGSTTWWNRTQQSRDELRRQGIVQRRRNGMCRKCFEREDRRRITATEPAPTRVVSADELLDEWRMMADPRLSTAENCRRLAPRLGMRWRSMERALKRAQASGRAA